MKKIRAWVFAFGVILCLVGAFVNGRVGTVLFLVGTAIWIGAVFLPEKENSLPKTTEEDDLAQRQVDYAEYVRPEACDQCRPCDDHQPKPKKS